MGHGLGVNHATKVTWRWQKAVWEPNCMEPAVLGGAIGLIGVVIGATGTLIAARMTTASAERVSREGRREEREYTVRNLAAEGYVYAVDAIQWLSTMHVEDSVDPKVAETYVPKTAEAVNKLREARQALMKAAALGGSGDLSRVTSETAVTLNMLDDAWHSTQHYCVELRKDQSSARMRAISKRLFDRSYQRLISARKALCGFEGDLSYREIDQGNVLPDSLLYRLREASAALLEQPPTVRRWRLNGGRSASELTAASRQEPV